MRKGRVLLLLAGAVAIAALGRGLVAPSSRRAPEGSPTSAGPAPRAPHAAPDRVATPIAPPVASPVASPVADALLARLASDDPFVVLDAADALAARKVTSAIPALVALPIVSMPNAAPSVIASLGKLAGVAPPPERAHAVAHLVGLVAREKARGAPESEGNVLVAYEALGKTRDPAAARALEAELRDPRVSNAAKTVIVASLAELGDPGSRAVLASARAEAAAARAPDPFEDEVREDLVAALDRALTR